MTWKAAIDAACTSDLHKRINERKPNEVLRQSLDNRSSQDFGAYIGWKNDRLAIVEWKREASTDGWLEIRSVSKYL